ncbi:hypothetical protein BLL52_4008 [Rhodoferax antarcticus ANT.BR]|uniref:Uncharacterized protein n=1 Tax=Rhodoferax antarcticus ANT.BR TaxID=1111071 RepID=A0A1Q8Y9R6_9BURK|nr:hypothetical protein BLL52_4008 [Rhodoferax antarcticus ANT.BR]
MSKRNSPARKSRAKDRQPRVKNEMVMRQRYRSQYRQHRWLAVSPPQSQVASG